MHPMHRKSPKRNCFTLRANMFISVVPPKFTASGSEPPKCCALIAPGNGGESRSPLLGILETKSFRRDRSRVTILGVRVEALSAAAPSLYHRRRPEPNPDQRVWRVWHWVEINPYDSRFSPYCQAHFREFFTWVFTKNRQNIQNEGK